MKPSKFCVDVTALTGMMSGGIPLLKSCSLLRENGLAPETRDTMRTLVYDLGEGISFSDALERQGVLPWSKRQVVSLVRMGERLGIMEDALMMLADYLKFLDWLVSNQYQNTLPIYELAIDVRIFARALKNDYPKSIAVNLLRWSGLLETTRQTMETLFKRVAGEEALSTTLKGAGRSRWCETDTRAFVRAGEDNGDLSGALGRLSSHLELEAKLRACWQDGFGAVLALDLLGNLLSSGAPILAALKTIEARQFDEATTRQVFLAYEQIKGGASIGDSALLILAGPYGAPLLDIGEATGRLDEMLLKASELLMHNLFAQAE